MSNQSPFENFNLSKFSVIGSILAESTRKYNEMIPAITEALQKFSEIVRPISEAVESFNVRFREIATVVAKELRPLVAIDIIKDAQYVYWDFIPRDFMEDVIASENIDKTLQLYESKNNYHKSDAVIDKCLKHPFILPQLLVFEQTVKLYYDGQYDLAVIGFLTVIDNVLTEASGNLTHQPLDRCNAILDKIKKNNALDSDEYAVLTLMLTFKAMIDRLFKTVKFIENEPEHLNRNWIMHGRSQKKKTRLDCIKLINFLYGIILIDELSRKEVPLNE